MSDSPRIRDAGADDLDALVDFNVRMAAETEDKALDPAVVRDGVRMGLERSELCRYFVAEIDEAVVGATMVTPELTDWRAGVIWWLQSVYVAPEFRRRGVFRALYRHIESLARGTDGVRGLRLYVHEANDRAVSTYNRLGMLDSGYRVLEADWSDAGESNL